MGTPFSTIIAPAGFDSTNTANSPCESAVEPAADAAGRGVGVGVGVTFGLTATRGRVGGCVEGVSGSTAGSTGFTSGVERASGAGGGEMRVVGTDWQAERTSNIAPRSSPPPQRLESPLAYRPSRSWGKQVLSIGKEWGWVLKWWLAGESAVHLSPFPRRSARLDAFLRFDSTLRCFWRFDSGRVRRRCASFAKRTSATCFSRAA